jgi:hypothetical protein
MVMATRIYLYKTKDTKNEVIFMRIAKWLFFIYIFILVLTSPVMAGEIAAEAGLITEEELYGRLADKNTAIIDINPADTYLGGHIPGAVNLDGDGAFAAREGMPLAHLVSGRHTALSGHVLQGPDTWVCDDSAGKISMDPAERADVGEGSRTDRR